MATMYIDQYPVFVRVGCFAEEQLSGQEVLVSICANMGALSGTGVLENTVNYAEVLKYMDQEIQDRSEALIESLVLQLGTGLLKKFTKFESVKVKIEKPRIPGGITKGSFIAIEENFKRGL